MHTYWKYVVEALLNVLCGLVLFLAPARKVCVTFLPTIWKVDSMEFPKTGVLQSTNPSDYQASKKRILWLIQESSRCRIDTKEQQEEFGSNCEGREYQCCLNHLKINIYIDLGRGPAERMKRFTSRSQCRRRSFGGCVICCWFFSQRIFYHKLYEKDSGNLEVVFSAQRYQNLTHYPNFFDTQHDPIQFWKSSGMG